MILTRKLYDYQEYAVKWLYEIESVWKCGILADDMGLGKTTDIIAHIINSYNRNPQQCNKKTLILCPLSLLHMWKNEFHKCTNFSEQQVIIYYGESRNLTFFEDANVIISTYDTLKSELQQIYKKNKQLEKITKITKINKKTKKLEKNQSSITMYYNNNNNKEEEDQQQEEEKEEKMLVQNYNFKNIVKINTLFEKYIKSYNVDMKEFPLLDTTWNRVVLDEAHKIRSLKSQITFAVQLLKSKYRICVTGSPINNTIYDLTSLAIWMRAKPYCNINWWLKNSLLNTQLDSWCKTFILMRQKKILINLPEINIANVYVDFLQPDNIIYDFITEKYLKKNNKNNIDDQCSFEQKNKSIALTWILKQRQICCHPLLMLGKEFTSLLLTLQKQDKLLKLKNAKYLLQLGKTKIKKMPLNFHVTMQNMWNYYTENLQNFNNNYYNNNNNNDNKYLIKPNAKIEYIVDYIKKKIENDPSSKFVIFSQWTSYLDLIEYFLLHDFKSFEISRFDGDMNFNERCMSMENFKTNKNNKIFISSLQTGGIGLNLVDANEMIITDPWYNPEIEKQAIDRMNRLGQTRPMQVTKILINSSVECNVTYIAKKKNYLTSDLFKI